LVLFGKGDGKFGVKIHGLKPRKAALLMGSVRRF